MKLKEIPRTATFAWSPDQKTPTIVTGTAAGTIDASFDATTELESWNLDSLDHSVAGFTPTPAARIETEARFHDLAFNRDGSVVVGAFESGVVEAWKVPDLTSVGSNATKHSGAVKSVAFSDKELAKFATGGAQGQVFVWDVTNMADPFAPGTIPAQRHDDVESVAWNHATAQILASGGNKGFASLWDTRRKREVSHSNYTSAAGTRCPISCVQWHPTISTKLATASTDDNEPVICIWDSKNANSPEKILRGHNKGVLSSDWCRQDSALMLSGGRDNATVSWNPETGEQLGSYPISVEWAFKTKFHPRMPDIFASASFDGKIAVQTSQDTHADTGSASTTATTAKTAKTTDGSDFWESETVMDAVHPNFQSQQAPKWLDAPTSINFGFGGKLVVATHDRVVIKTIRDSSSNDDVSQSFGTTSKDGNFEKLAADKAGASSSWKSLAGSLEDKPELDLPKGPSEDQCKKDEDDEEEDVFDFVPEYTPGDSPLESSTSKHPAVVRAVLANDLDAAVSQLISAGEPGDASSLATYGDASLVTRAQNAYLAAHAAQNAYSRVAWDISRQQLGDLVAQSELAAWPSVSSSVLASPDSQLHTYTLGKRLVQAGDRDNALKIYFAGKNVAALASSWLDEVPEIEKRILAEGGVTAYVAHVRASQQVVEKIAAVTSKLGVPPLSDEGADRSYSASRDYADIAAQQGDLELAKSSLDMSPDEFADDKQRINVATETAAAKPSVRTAATAAPGVSAGRGRPLAISTPAAGYIPALGSSDAGSSSPIPPAPTGRAQPVRAAAPSAAGTASSSTSGKNRYAPSSYAAANAANPPAPAGAPGANSPYFVPAGSNTAATSAAASVAAAPPPPPPAVGQSAKAANGANAPFKGWNDIPESPGGSRRTPAAPTRVAPARNVTAPPSSAESSRRSSESGPSAAQSPPPPPVGGLKNPAAGVPGSPALSAGPSGSAGIPPRSTSSPRPVNPYAPKTPSARASPAPSAAAKPNPYAPPPTAAAASAVSGPPPVASAPPPGPGSSTRPPSRSGAPMVPRVRAAPPPAVQTVPSPIPTASTPAAVAPPPAAVPPPRTSSRAAHTSAAPAPPKVASNAANSANAAAAPPTSNAAVGQVLSAQAQAIKDGFQAESARVQPMYEAQYAKLYKDTVKRSHKSYEHSPGLSEAVTARSAEISDAFGPHDIATAKQSLEAVITQHSEEAGEWSTGVKRLVNVSEKLPVA